MTTNDLLIPDDLREYLSANPDTVLHLKAEEGDQLEVENVQLPSLQALQLADFDLDSSEYHLNYGEFDKNPELRYQFPGVDLIAKELDGYYDAEGILIWFPDLKRYGTWDADHHIIYTFPTATWTKIMDNPGGFINAQWFPNEEEHELLMPWHDQGLGVEMDKFIVPKDK